jgi:hypothetical protein
MRIRFAFLILSILGLSALFLGELPSDGMLNGFQALGMVVCLGVVFVCVPKS